ncbi:hypothetical protein ASC71_21670 [Rhizobium sp. Root1240]|nr:hypothetical protein ASC71_21670 [Rhizobium sp. Root1240]
MQHWPALVVERCQSRFEHGLNKLEDRPPRSLERDDLAVMQVHDRREVEFFVGEAELSDVCDPFLMHVLGVIQIAG